MENGSGQEKRRKREEKEKMGSKRVKKVKKKELKQKGLDRSRITTSREGVKKYDFWKLNKYRFLRAKI